MNHRDRYDFFADDAVIVTPGVVPLTNGVGGEVIGSAEYLDDGSIFTHIDNPSFIKRLGFAAGMFSLRDTAHEPLCHECGNDRCDDLIFNISDCLCCKQGHVQ